MDAAEFDKFAEEYMAAHKANLKISGEDPDFFARYKLDEIERLWKAKGFKQPARVLDFGCGIGSSLPHLQRIFPQAQVVGLDVSEKSLQIAAIRFPGVAELVAYDGETLPFEPQRFDLVFSSCVFHHIDHGRHEAILGDLRKILSDDGHMVIFEHNPINPVTRYIVATCPFDENAVLVPAPALKATEIRAGFSAVETRFLGFFPGPLSALRPLEPALGFLPIGAQYYTLAHA
jgi:ubiquinone/menaquinone biosynthesis C-methylase UbiE